MKYFRSTFNKELTYMRRKYLKKELRDYVNESLDLVHYAGLINEIKANGSIETAHRKQEYFFNDLNKIYKKYALLT